jgi:transposase-like protein
LPKPSLRNSKQDLSSDASPPASNATGTSAESTPLSGKRRTFTAAEKLRIVSEAASVTERGGVGALLRREGIYSSHLGAWRAQLALSGSEGLGTRKRGPKPHGDAQTRRIAELEKQAARLTSRLALAEKLIALQKKVSEILGIDLGSADES